MYTEHSKYQNNIDIEGLRKAMMNKIDRNNPEHRRLLDILKLKAQHIEDFLKKKDLKNIEITEHSLVYHILEGKHGTIIRDLKKALPSWPYIKPDGSVIGDGKYGLLDPGWAGCMLALWEHISRPPFPNDPPIIQIPSQFKIAVFGDWAGGNWEVLEGGHWVHHDIASTIAGLIKAQQPDCCIHLGDVYYDGSSREQKAHLLDLWPEAPFNFHLNSNHDMYRSARCYFGEALQSPLFKAQKGHSFFALENDAWILIGLDSAYASDKSHLFMNGCINQEQMHFLEHMASINNQREQGDQKSFMVLTHHNGLDHLGGTPVPIVPANSINAALMTSVPTFWDQISQPLGEHLKYWIWGHDHTCVVYQDYQGVKTRTLGHGVIPWGTPTDLLPANNPHVEWVETQKSGSDWRVQNGFAMLEFHGKRLEEKIYGEDGQVHWSSEWAG